jgi:uncharacterized membrane protein YhdT
MVRAMTELLRWLASLLLLFLIVVVAVLVKTAAGRIGWPSWPAAAYI